MKLVKCPQSGLMLPMQFVDEKIALTKVINKFVEESVNQMQGEKENYFLTFHAKFDTMNLGNFNIAAPKVTRKLPPFMSNTLVWFVSNARGICELIWMVPPKKPGQKLKVEFNTTGVAYLQAKGAMPS